MKISFKKTIGTLTLFCFLFEQYSWAASSGSLSPVFSPEIPISKSFEIPAELAHVETIHTSPQKSDKAKVVFYIQNIHAHREAQSQIEKIVKYLHDKYGVRDLFLEGAAEDLDPTEIQIFKDPKLNQKYAEILAEKGDLTGPEMALLSEGPKLNGRGIEDADLYRQNYEALKKVFQEENKINQSLNDYEKELDRSATKILSPQARKLLKEWKRFESGQREFLPYLKMLSEEARNLLKLDLTDLYSQIKWPHLTRMIALQQMEKTVKRDQAEKEKTKLLQFLRSKKISPNLIESLRGQSLLGTVPHGDRSRRNLRNLLEKLAREAGPKGFYFDDYPEFSLAAGFEIVRSELDAKKVFEEIEKLFSDLLDVSVSTSEQKSLIELYREAALIRKLLRLELNREEWKKVKDGRIGKNGKEEGRTGKKNQNSYSSLPIDHAYHFYEAAIQRETAFNQKIREQMSANKISKAIVVTGGFHSEALTKAFKDQETNYILLTPTISDIPSTFHQDYRDIMLQSRKTSAELATIEQPLALQPDRSELRMGWNVEHRKQFHLDAANQVNSEWRIVNSKNLITNDPSPPTQSSRSELRIKMSRRNFIVSLSVIIGTLPIIGMMIYFINQRNTRKWLENRAALQFRKMSEQISESQWQTLRFIDITLAAGFIYYGEEFQGVTASGNLAIEPPAKAPEKITVRILKNLPKRFQIFFEPFFNTRSIKGYETDSPYLQLLGYLDLVPFIQTPSLNNEMQKFFGNPKTMVQTLSDPKRLTQDQIDQIKSRILLIHLNYFLQMVKKYRGHGLKTKEQWMESLRHLKNGKFFNGDDFTLRASDTSFSTEFAGPYDQNRVRFLERLSQKIETSTSNFHFISTKYEIIYEIENFLKSQGIHLDPEIPNPSRSELRSSFHPDKAVEANLTKFFEALQRLPSEKPIKIPITKEVRGMPHSFELQLQVHPGGSHYRRTTTAHGTQFSIVNARKLQGKILHGDVMHIVEGSPVRIGYLIGNLATAQSGRVQLENTIMQTLEEYKGFKLMKALHESLATYLPNWGIKFWLRGISNLETWEAIGHKMLDLLGNTLHRGDLQFQFQNLLTQANPLLLQNFVISLVLSNRGLAEWVSKNIDAHSEFLKTTLLGKLTLAAGFPHQFLQLMPMPEIEGIPGSEFELVLVGGKRPPRSEVRSFEAAIKYAEESSKLLKRLQEFFYSQGQFILKKEPEIRALQRELSGRFEKIQKCLKALQQVSSIPIENSAQLLQQTQIELDQGLDALAAGQMAFIGLYSFHQINHEISEKIFKRKKILLARMTPHEWWTSLFDVLMEKELEFRGEKKSLRFIDPIWVRESRIGISRGSRHHDLEGILISPVATSVQNGWGDRRDKVAAGKAFLRAPLQETIIEEVRHWMDSVLKKRAMGFEVFDAQWAIQSMKAWLRSEGIFSQALHALEGNMPDQYNLIQAIFEATAFLATVALSDDPIKTYEEGIGKQKNKLSTSPHRMGVELAEKAAKVTFPNGLSYNNHQRRLQLKTLFELETGARLDESPLPSLDEKGNVSWEGSLLQVTNADMDILYPATRSEVREFTFKELIKFCFYTSGSRQGRGLISVISQRGSAHNLFQLSRLRQTKPFIQGLNEAGQKRLETLISKLNAQQGPALIEELNHEFITQFQSWEELLALLLIVWESSVAQQDREPIFQFLEVLSSYSKQALKQETFEITDSGRKFSVSLETSFYPEAAFFTAPDGETMFLSKRKLSETYSQVAYQGPLVTEIRIENERVGYITANEIQGEDGKELRDSFIFILPRWTGLKIMKKAHEHLAPILKERAINRWVRVITNNETLYQIALRMKPLVEGTEIEPAFIPSIRASLAFDDSGTVQNLLAAILNQFWEKRIELFNEGFTRELVLGKLSLAAGFPEQEVTVAYYQDGTSSLILDVRRHPIKRSEIRSASRQAHSKEPNPLTVGRSRQLAERNEESERGWQKAESSTKEKRNLAGRFEDSDATVVGLKVILSGKGGDHQLDKSVHPVDFDFEAIHFGLKAIHSGFMPVHSYSKIVHLIPEVFHPLAKNFELAVNIFQNHFEFPVLRKFRTRAARLTHYFLSLFFEVLRTLFLFPSPVNIKNIKYLYNYIAYQGKAYSPIQPRSELRRDGEDSTEYRVRSTASEQEEKISQLGTPDSGLGTKNFESWSGTRRQAIQFGIAGALALASGLTLLQAQEKVESSKPTERPWKNFKDTRSPEGIRQCLLQTLQWMKDHKYPSPEILIFYETFLKRGTFMMAQKEEELRQMPILSKMLLTPQQALIFLNQLHLSSILTEVKEAEDAGPFIRKVVSIMGREAWGLDLLKGMQDKEKAGSIIRRNISQSMESLNYDTEKILERHDSDIEKLVLDNISGEVFELYRQVDVLEWGKTIFPESQISKNTSESKFNLDELALQRSNLQVFLEFELSVWLTNSLGNYMHKKGFHSQLKSLPIQQFAYDSFVISEIRRWQKTEGREGLDLSTLQEYLLQKKNLPPHLFRSSAERLMKIMSEQTKSQILGNAPVLQNKQPRSELRGNTKQVNGGSWIEDSKKPSTTDQSLTTPSIRSEVRNKSWEKRLFLGAAILFLGFFTANMEHDDWPRQDRALRMEMAKQLEGFRAELNSTDWFSITGVSEIQWKKGPDKFAELAKIWELLRVLNAAGSGPLRDRVLFMNPQGIWVIELSAADQRRIARYHAPHNTADFLNLFLRKDFPAWFFQHPVYPTIVWSQNGPPDSETIDQALKAFMGRSPSKRSEMRGLKDWVAKSKAPLAISVLGGAVAGYFLTKPILFLGLTVTSLLFWIQMIRMSKYEDLPIIYQAMVMLTFFFALGAYPLFAYLSQDPLIMTSPYFMILGISVALIGSVNAVLIYKAQTHLKSWGKRFFRGAAVLFFAGILGFSTANMEHDDWPRKDRALRMEMAKQLEGFGIELNSQDWFAITSVSETNQEIQWKKGSDNISGLETVWDLLNLLHENGYNPLHNRVLFISSKGIWVIEISAADQRRIAQYHAPHNMADFLNLFLRKDFPAWFFQHPVNPTIVWSQNGPPDSETIDRALKAFMGRSPSNRSEVRLGKKNLEKITVALLRKTREQMREYDQNRLEDRISSYGITSDKELVEIAQKWQDVFGFSLDQFIAILCYTRIPHPLNFEPENIAHDAKKVLGFTPDQVAYGLLHYQAHYFLHDAKDFEERHKRFLDLARKLGAEKSNEVDWMMALGITYVDIEKIEAIYEVAKKNKIFIQHPVHLFDASRRMAVMAKKEYKQPLSTLWKNKKALFDALALEALRKGWNGDKTTIHHKYVTTQSTLDSLFKLTKRSEIRLETAENSVFAESYRHGWLKLLVSPTEGNKTSERYSENFEDWTSGFKKHLGFNPYRIYKRYKVYQQLRKELLNELIEAAGNFKKNDGVSITNPDGKVRRYFVQPQEELLTALEENHFYESEQFQSFIDKILDQSSDQNFSPAVTRAQHQLAKNISRTILDQASKGHIALPAQYQKMIWEASVVPSRWKRIMIRLNTIFGPLAVGYIGNFVEFLFAAIFVRTVVIFLVLVGLLTAKDTLPQWLASFDMNIQDRDFNAIVLTIESLVSIWIANRLGNWLQKHSEHKERQFRQSILVLMMEGRDVSECRKQLQEFRDLFTAWKKQDWAKAEGIQDQKQARRFNMLSAKLLGEVERVIYHGAAFRLRYREIAGLIEKQMKFAQSIGMTLRIDDVLLTMLEQFEDYNKDFLTDIRKTWKWKGRITRIIHFIIKWRWWTSSEWAFIRWNVFERLQKLTNIQASYMDHAEYEQVFAEREAVKMHPESRESQVMERKDILVKIRTNLVMSGAFDAFFVEEFLRRIEESVVSDHDRRAILVAYITGAVSRLLHIIEGRVSDADYLLRISRASKTAWCKLTHRIHEQPSRFGFTEEEAEKLENKLNILIVKAGPWFERAEALSEKNNPYRDLFFEPGTEKTPRSVEEVQIALERKFPGIFEINPANRIYAFHRSRLSSDHAAVIPVFYEYVESVSKSSHRSVSVLDTNLGHAHSLRNHNVITSHTSRKITNRPYHAILSQTGANDDVLKKNREIVFGRWLNERHFVFHLDHHYPSLFLSGTSTGLLTADVIRYAYEQEKTDLLNQMAAHTNAFIDHSDADILISNFLMRNAADKSLLPHFDWIGDAAIYNDYQILRGKPELQGKVRIFYAYMRGIDESIFHGKMTFSEGLAKVRDGIDFALKYGGEGHEAAEQLYRRLESLDPSESRQAELFRIGFQDEKDADTVIKKILSQESLGEFDKVRMLGKQNLPQGFWAVQDDVIIFSAGNRNSIGGPHLMRYLYAERPKETKNVKLLIVLRPQESNIGEKYHVKLQFLVDENGGMGDLNLLIKALRDFYPHAGGRATAASLGIQAAYNPEEAIKNVLHVAKIYRDLNAAAVRSEVREEAEMVLTSFGDSLSNVMSEAQAIQVIRQRFHARTKNEKVSIAVTVDNPVSFGVLEGLGFVPDKSLTQAKETQQAKVRKWLEKNKKDIVGVGRVGKILRLQFKEGIQALVNELALNHPIAECPPAFQQLASGNLAFIDELFKQWDLRRVALPENHQEMDPVNFTIPDEASKNRVIEKVNKGFARIDTPHETWEAWIIPTPEWKPYEIRALEREKNEKREVEAKLKRDLEIQKEFYDLFMSFRQGISQMVRDPGFLARVTTFDDFIDRGLRRRPEFGALLAKSKDMKIYVPFNLLMTLEERVAQLLMKKNPLENLLKKGHLDEINRHWGTWYKSSQVMAIDLPDLLRANTGKIDLSEDINLRNLYGIQVFFLWKRFHVMRFHLLGKVPDSLGVEMTTSTQSLDQKRVQKAITSLLRLSELIRSLAGIYPEETHPHLNKTLGRYYQQVAENAEKLADSFKSLPEQEWDSVPHKIQILTDLLSSLFQIGRYSVWIEPDKIYPEEASRAKQEEIFEESVKLLEAVGYSKINMRQYFFGEDPAVEGGRSEVRSKNQKFEEAFYRAIREIQPMAKDGAFYDYKPKEDNRIPLGIQVAHNIATRLARFSKKRERDFLLSRLDWKIQAEDGAKNWAVVFYEKTGPSEGKIIYLFRFRITASGEAQYASQFTQSLLSRLTWENLSEERVNRHDYLAIPLINDSILESIRLSNLIACLRAAVSGLKGIKPVLNFKRNSPLFRKMKTYLDRTKSKSVKEGDVMKWAEETLKSLARSEVRGNAMLEHGWDGNAVSHYPRLLPAPPVEPAFFKDPSEVLRHLLQTSSDHTFAHRVSELIKQERIKTGRRRNQRLKIKRSEAFLRPANALDHFFQALPNYPKTLEGFQEAFPAPNGTLDHDHVLRKLLKHEGSESLRFIDRVKLLPVAYPAYANLAGEEIERKAVALDHFFNSIEGTWPRNLATLQRYVPEPPQVKGDMLAESFYVLLKNGKPSGLTWNDFAKVLPIAREAWRPVMGRGIFFEKTISILDHLGGKDIQKPEAAVQYAAKHSNELKVLAETYYFPSLKGRHATLEGIVRFFFYQVLYRDGALPKTPGGRQPLIQRKGLAPGTFIVYLPKLSYHFARWIEEWNRDHFPQSSDALALSRQSRSEVRGMAEIKVNDSFVNWLLRDVSEEVLQDFRIDDLLFRLGLKAPEVRKLIVDRNPILPQGGTFSHKSLDLKRISNVEIETRPSLRILYLPAENLIVKIKEIGQHVTAPLFRVSIRSGETEDYVELRVPSDIKSNELAAQIRNKILISHTNAAETLRELEEKFPLFSEELQEKRTTREALRITRLLTTRVELAKKEKRTDYKSIYDEIAAVLQGFDRNFYRQAFTGSIGSNPNPLVDTLLSTALSLTFEGAEEKPLESLLEELSKQLDDVHLILKTEGIAGIRKRHQGSNGFNMTGFEPRENRSEIRIWKISKQEADSRMQKTEKINANVFSSGVPRGRFQQPKQSPRQNSKLYQSSSISPFWEGYTTSPSQTLTRKERIRQNVILERDLLKEQKQIEPQKESLPGPSKSYPLYRASNVQTLSSPRSSRIRNISSIVNNNLINNEYLERLRRAQATSPVIQVVAVAGGFIDIRISGYEKQKALMDQVQALHESQTPQWMTNFQEKGLVSNHPGWVVDLYENELPSMEEIQANRPLWVNAHQGKTLMVIADPENLRSLQTKAVKILQDEAAWALENGIDLKNRFTIRVISRTAQLERELARLSSQVLGQMKMWTKNKIGTGPGETDLSLNLQRYFVVTGQKALLERLEKIPASFLVRESYQDYQTLTAAHWITAAYSREMKAEKLKEQYGPVLQEKGAFLYFDLRILSQISETLQILLGSARQIHASA